MPVIKRPKSNHYSTNFARKLNKERNSTIREDPFNEETNLNQTSDTLSQEIPLQTTPDTQVDSDNSKQTSNPSHSNKARPHRQRSLFTMAHRLTSFLRLFSITRSNSGSPNSSPGRLNSLSNQICDKCNKPLTEATLLGMTKILDENLAPKCIEENISEEEIEEKDFTTKILTGTETSVPLASSVKGLKSQHKFTTSMEKKAAEDDLKEIENTFSDNSGNKNTSSTNNNFYQNQPFKCFASSISPKLLLSIIHERLESHKKVDINASTMAGSHNNKYDLFLFVY